MNKVTSKLACLLLIGLVSCGSTDLYGKNRSALDSANSSLAAGRYKDAIDRSEGLLTETAADKGAYRLQRFFAAHLISRAHSEASFAGPFLTEPNRDAAFSLDGGSKGRKESPTAHLVAAAWWAAIAV